jgi:hypothetical protein
MAYLEKFYLRRRDHLDIPLKAIPFQRASSKVLLEVLMVFGNEHE